MKRLQFEKTIKAPRQHVWDAMLSPDTYKDWTSAFTEGSYYEGSWERGQRVRFLSPDGDGLLAEIVEIRPPDFVSMRHIGEIRKRVEHPATWGESFENYSLTGDGDTTTVQVELDVDREHQEPMRAMWPKALERLARLCEGARRQCPECRGGMEEGFLVDRGDYNAAHVPSWVAGVPVLSFWEGLQMKDRSRYRVRTLRCTACGLLRSYADVVAD